MHHLHIHALHAPLFTTKYKIYLVDLPSILYERSGQNETSVLNQLFLRFSGAVSCAFDKSTTFYTRSTTLHENLQNQVNMCVYMHYLHIHAPPNTTKYHQLIRYTLLAFPLYSMKDQVKMRHPCWISCFCCFSGAFHVFLMKALLFIQEVPLFFMKKCHFSWKPTKPGQYVCIHALFTHTCTTKYDQIPLKYKIYFAGFPSVLYERPGQNEISVLNQLFMWLFRYFSCAFHEKVPLFMKTNKTRSICVYTCTIYTYMHHQLPQNIRYT